MINYKDIGNSIKIIESDESLLNQLNQLKELYDQLNDAGKKVLELDIKKLEFGILGEKQLLFELKNSRIPLYVAPNTFFSFDNLESQIDFLVFTDKMCFVIESKNLYGDIEVTEDGNFIRSYMAGSKKVREGIYSPITQNNRHMDILRKLRKNRQNLLLKGMSDSIFDSTFKSIVVLTNPNTVLNIKSAPKQIKDQIIRSDQLVNYIEKVYHHSKQTPFTKKQVLEWVEKTLADSSIPSKNYSSKYESFKLLKIDNKVNIDNDDNLREALKMLRTKLSKDNSLKPYLVYTNEQLELLVETKPKSLEKLKSTNGFGDHKCQKFGNDIIEILKQY